MTLEYLVDPINGDDGAPGTLNDPWLTTQHAGWALSRIDAGGQNVKLWLAQGTHGRLVIPNGPLNLASEHYDEGLVIEGDGLPSQIIIPVAGNEWGVHNLARTTIKNITLEGEPSSNGVKSESNLTVLDDVVISGCGIPLRCTSHSRLEASGLVLIGASNTFVELFSCAFAEISDVSFDTWSYDETFAAFIENGAHLGLADVVWTGATPGVAAKGYDVTPFSTLSLNGLTIPESVVGTVHADGRVYA